MIIIDCEQNSPEWRAARIGRVTASCMEKIISPTAKESSQADKYMTQLIAELMTGESAETFKGNANTARGKELEQEGADYYAMLRGVELRKVGFCTTDDGLVGCSPDRLVGDDGMLEIKTGIGSTMVEYYEMEDPETKLEQDHRPQTQGGLYVTKRKWIDTLLFHPTVKKQLIVRANINEAYITSMSGMLGRFHAKMHDRITKLRNKGYMEAA